MRRLYLQIYLAVSLTSLIVMFIGAGIARHYRPEVENVPPLVTGVAHLIGQELPPIGSPDTALESALADLSERLEVDAQIWTAEGTALASAGAALPTPVDWQRPTVFWSRGRYRGPPGVSVPLADGRVLSVSPRDRDDHGGRGLIAFALFALTVGIGAFPVSRRIVRRLERLKSGVDELREGDLTARVPVEGRDEVAQLAQSFNAAADRIEQLVDAQRRGLASASHELRSPLARLRVAVELLGKDGDPELVREADTDIEELDALIGDLLLTARLEAGTNPVEAERVALDELVGEEAERVGAAMRREPVTLRGDPRLLRRMVRNLLENARRHGDGATVEAWVQAYPGSGGDAPAARLSVSDRGPGVPESERERIFEPFYRPAGHSEGRDGGVGLGLALVRDIARHHGGEARCLAREGGGTVFQVDLEGC